MTPLPDPPPSEPVALVLVGVAGSGKTTIGRRVAARLGWTFLDADDFHPPENVARMEAGQGLTDAERGPWLDAVREAMAHSLEAGQSLVVACSALRRRYRAQLRAGDPRVRFVVLDVPEEELSERLDNRPGHYAGADLLPSQLEAWEPMDPDEGVHVRATGPVDSTVRAVLSVLEEDG